MGLRDRPPGGVAPPGPDPAELLPEPVFLVLDAGPADINQALRVEVVVVALVQGLIRRLRSGRSTPSLGLPG